MAIDASVSVFDLRIYITIKYGKIVRKIVKIKQSLKIAYYIILTGFSLSSLIAKVDPRLVTASPALLAPFKFNEFSHKIKNKSNKSNN